MNGSPKDTSTESAASGGTHSHDFGTSRTTSGERRTRWVVAVTLVMMIAEIAAGLHFGSMALLADGWHMGTHAAALGVTVFAYVYARHHASDPRYTFGTGKVGALAGFASAIGLAVVALVVLAESVGRLLSPVRIRFAEAIAVAVIGLIVNLVSAILLGHDHDHDGGAETAHHHDHNLRGAYLHVLADALTSVLAIFALLTGMSFGWNWLDPLVGLVGSLVIARWSWGLLRETSAVLLDGEIPQERLQLIQQSLEACDDNRVGDLHVWRVGPRHLAAVVTVVTPNPRPPAHYRALLAQHSDLVHVTVEVQERDGNATEASRAP